MPVSPRNREPSPAPSDSIPLPRHHTAYLLLRQRIELMATDAFLPGEHELSAEFGISRMTLRRAMARLEQEGRVVRRRGDGTRVARPSGGIGGRPADTVAQLLLLGRRMTTRVLTVEEVVAPADAASGLRLPPGALARRAELIRHLGAVPVSHLSAYFPATPRFRQVTGPAVAARPLLALTEALGGPVRELVQTIGAVLADPPLSELLAVDAGAPLVRVARRLVGRDGPLQYSVAHYRADCFSLETIEVQSGKGWRREMRMQLAEHDGLPRETPAPRPGRRVARPG